jgi:predicted AAA+ superfamily ATPase
MAGSIFENYIISEVMKKEIHQKSNAELFYLRTSQGEEICHMFQKYQ